MQLPVWGSKSKKDWEERNSFRDMSAIMKHSNLHIMGALEGNESYKVTKKKKEEEEEEIQTENFLNLLINSDICILETQWFTNSINSKWSTMDTSYIFERQREILRAIRELQQTFCF